MTDSENSGTWEEGPTTLDDAADYAHYIRERLQAHEADGDPAHLQEALRLIDMLEGYLKMQQRESD